MQRAPSFPSEQHNGELKVAAEFRVEAASGDHPHGGLREIFQYVPDWGAPSRRHFRHISNENLPDAF